MYGKTTGKLEGYFYRKLRIKIKESDENMMAKMIKEWKKI
jgi:hypothetical protein